MRDMQFQDTGGDAKAWPPASIQSGHKNIYMLLLHDETYDGLSSGRFARAPSGRSVPRTHQHGGADSRAPRTNTGPLEAPAHRSRSAGRGGRHRARWKTKPSN